MSLSVPASDESDDRVLAPKPGAWQPTSAAGNSAQLALASLGFVLLAVLVYQAGPRELAEHLRVLGWSAPLIFLPYALSSVLDAAGWRVTFVQFRPRLWLLYLARLIGGEVSALDRHVVGVQQVLEVHPDGVAAPQLVQLDVGAQDDTVAGDDGHSGRGGGENRFEAAGRVGIEQH